MPSIIFKLIIKYLFRSVFRTFATFLILLGVSLLFPGLREYLITLAIVDGLDVDPPRYLREDNPWGVFAAAGFIVAGFISFAIGWWVDLVRAVKDRKPVIKVADDPSWLINLDGDNNIYDPKVATSVNLRITAGTIPVLLDVANLYRYVDGCRMSWRSPSLIRRSTGETIPYAGSCKRLEESYVIPELQQVTLVLARIFYGPTEKYRFGQMERGDLKIDIAFSLGNCPDVEERTFYFRQSGGSLVEKDSIAKPPLLNDDLLAEALENDVITLEEHDQIKKVTERQRFLYIRDGDDFLSTCLELSDLPNLQKLLKDANRRIGNMQVLQVASDSDESTQGQF